MGARGRCWAYKCRAFSKSCKPLRVTKHITLCKGADMPTLAGAQAERRWCLTGTPIQNSVDDLYPYFRFLQYQPYARAAAFKSTLKDALASSPDLGARRLRAALQVRTCYEGRKKVLHPFQPPRAGYMVYGLTVKSSRSMQSKTKGAT